MAISNTGVRYDLIARDSASRTFNTVGSNASKLERGLGKLGKAAVAAGAALAGGIAVGLAESAKKAVEFQSEMTKIQTQAGASAKDVAVLSKGVLELGKTTQQGPQKLAEAMFHLKSVGMDNADALKSLKVASDLAAVGGSDLEATTNALAGAWRSGIKGAETFSTAAATVNAVIGAGNMRMEDFVSAIGTGILPSAKSFGLSLNQVGAALALMTDEGIPAVDAATRLRMSFSLLGAPSKAAEKQLGKIGLTGLDLANAMRGPDGLIGAVQLLKDHLDASGLSAAQQSQILSRAFGGGRSSSGILTLLNNLDVLKQKQDQVNGSMSKFGPAVVAQRKTVKAQLDLIKSNLEVMSIELGNKLLPPLSSFVVYINKTALPAVSHFGGSLLGLIPVGQIKAGVSTVQGIISDLFAGLQGPKKVALPSPSLAMPATTIPAGLAAPKSQAQQLGEQLRTALSGGIGDAIGNIDWGKLGKSLGEGLGKMTKFLTVNTADIVKKLGQIFGAIDWVSVGKIVGGKALSFAIGFLDSMATELFSPSFWKKHWLDTIVAALSVVGVGKLAGPLAKIFDRFPVLRAFSPVLKKINGLTKPLSDAVGGVTKFFGSSLWKGFARVFPEAAAVLERESGLLTTRIGVWGLDLLGAGRRAIRALGDGIKAGFEWPIAKLGEGIGLMLKPFVNAGSWLIRASSDMIAGLTGGIGRAMVGIGTWLKGVIVDPVVNWVKALFGIHSPSTVFAGIGGQLIAGLLLGVTAAARGIGKWLSAHVVSPVVGAFGSAGSWLYSRGAQVVDGLESGAWSVAKGVGGWFRTNVIGRVTSPFAKASGWLTGPGADIVRGLISGTWAVVNDAKTGIGHWAGQIKDKIVGAIKSVFHIHSPSRVMAELGGHMMSGLMQGLLQGKDVLNATVKGLFHSPLDAAQALLSSGVSLPASWVGKLLSAKAPQAAGTPLAPGVAGAQAYASQLVAQMWPKNAGAEMSALRSLWNAESGWRANAENMSSGAYGIPQALPATKMASAGADWKRNAATQIRWGLSYIKGRYGDPATAWGSWNAHKPHWYDQGGIARHGGYIPKLTNQPERVLSPRQTQAFEQLVAVLANGGSTAGGVEVHVHVNDPRLKDLIDVQVKASEKRAAFRAKVGGS